MAEVPARSPMDESAVERRIVSVLFADLVGFTPLSERLDAEDVAIIQDRYFGATRDTIERYGGVVEKFIGDAVMAVFGAPRARDDDAERAVRAGLALIGAVEQLGAALGLEAGDLQLRVGITSGEVVHATAGPDTGRVTGDTVNTAARLQAAAEPGTVLIGELTALTVAETIATEAVGEVELKGKARPVRAWRAIGARSQPSREEALGALHAPTIGRDMELTHLRAAVAQAARDHLARRIVVVAPPGVGKSRVLAELGSDPGAPATVLRARVRPQATAPFETVAQLLASAGVDRLDTALAGAEIPEGRSAVIRDEVRRVMTPDPTSAAPTGDLGAERDARFDAWITALDALAGRAATWLVEDVHWAGGDLLAFLDRAGAKPSRFGRVVVATARPSLLESAPAWCDAERVDLAPLPPDDAAGLVRALLGADLPDELLAAVVERSDGTPLFIEELLRTWASVGTLVPSKGAWRLAVHPTSVTLPPTVQAIYAAQLDDLSPDARTVARRGAVAGRRVPTGAFAALDIPDGAGLAALRRRALLTGPMRDPITGEGWTYRHALLRDAGYASLARAERARLHLAMARWLASVAGSSADAVAEAVAEHLASALDSLPGLVTGELPARAALAGEASAWFERAADSALRLAAIDACCRLTERSIELTAPDERRDLARRRRRLGEVLAASADLDRGIAELEAALECCPDDPESVTASAYALGRAYMQQIRFAEAERLTAETLERSPDAPAAERARLHALHAWSVAAQGATDGVLAEADLADAAAREAGDPELEIDVLEHVAAARDEVGAAGEEHWARLEDRARELGRWRQAVSAARSRAIYRGIDDPAAAVPMLEAAGELARARGLTEEAGWVDYQTCETLWLVGAWDDAVRVGLRAIEIAERNAYQRLAFRTFVVLLPLAAARGDEDLVERFRGWWDGAASQLPASPSPYARLLREAIEVWQAPADGPVPLAPEETLDAIVPMLNAHFIAAVESVVSAWVRAGRMDLATRAAERVAGFAADDDATPLMRASASLLAAWLAGAVGDSDAAGRAADAAAGHARGIGAAWWLARALRAGGSDAEAAAIERRLGIG